MGLTLAVAKETMAAVTFGSIAELEVKFGHPKALVIASVAIVSAESAPVSVVSLVGLIG